MKQTDQLKTWTEEFGRIYTDRNTPATREEIDSLTTYGDVTARSLIGDFLGPRTVAEGRVLEVGTNVGLKLYLLHEINPALQLFGLEPQTKAIIAARSLVPEAFIIPGSALEIPFRDAWFDVVMTIGVLIHIAPNDLPTAMAEIVRCSKRHILMHEYFSEETEALPYRGRMGLLWRANYGQLYQETFPDLKIINSRIFSYTSTTGELVRDQVCLFEKCSPDEASQKEPATDNHPGN